LQPPPTIAPVQHNIEVPEVSAPPRRRAKLESNPFESKGSRGMFVGFLVGLLVIGAAYGLAMKKGINPIAASRNLISTLRNWDAPPTPPQFSMGETKAANAPAISPAKAPTESAAPAVHGLDPTLLPAAGAGAITPAQATDVLADAKNNPKVAAKPVTRVAAEAPAPKPEPKPEPVAQAPKPAPVAKAEPAQPEPDPNSLAGAIKKAVGPQDAPKAAAVEAPDTPAVRGDIPEAPPQGAIQGAIGSHRQAARACLEGQDTASRATIVFASTGKVQSVNVAGPAAGTRAEGCIVKTLSKAAVGPFRRPTFSVTTTISPP
jgi:hypothetical protein